MAYRSYRLLILLAFAQGLDSQLTNYQQQQQVPPPPYRSGQQGYPQGQYGNSNPNPNYYQYDYGRNGLYPQQGYRDPWIPPQDVTFRTPALQRFGIVKPSSMDLEKKSVSVETPMGVVSGYAEPLFDTPAIHYLDRPGTPSRPTARIELIVHTFLGIPYALPPIGDKRFKPPEPYGAFQSYTAQNYRAMCPQPEPPPFVSLPNWLFFGEDCLHLNIFTPSTISGITNPVMIYLHGGEFESGSGNLFPGHMLAASQQVVVVTVNYRLGPLGFLSTGDGASPGNYGMLDQAMAIQWVYNNIRAFSGDPDRVTLFGPGAGAASAGLHMVSPLTRNFVKRVIGQSGSALADWAAVTNLEKARNTSRVFGDRVGCSRDSSYKLVECLRQRSAKELCNQNIKPEIGFFPWSPVVDRELPLEDKHRFLPESPLTLFSGRFFNPDRDYLAGMTRDEAAYMLLKDFALEKDGYRVTQEYFNRKVREYIKQYNYTLNPDGIYQAMTYMYTNWADPYNPNKIREEYINMMSDAFFRAPTDDMVKLMVRRDVRTFMYVLNTTVESFKWPEWRAISHDTEFYFVTGAPFMESSYFAPHLFREKISEDWTEGDRNMSKFFMTAFANFAKSGNPTQIPIMDIAFKKMAGPPDTILYYLNVNNTLNSTIERNYRQLELSFWTKYLPTLIGNPPPTTPLPMDQNIEFQIGFYGIIAGACLFFLLMIIMCCLYCRAMTRPHDRYYEESIDNYSTQNMSTSMSFIHGKNGEKYDSQQHTTV